MPKLDKNFYLQDTLTVAPKLLGKYLVRVQNGASLAARITETEAYVGRIDKACHAYGGKRTARTETLFAPPGTAYIYLIYGMYNCLNFVTEPENEPCAVLIRSVEAVHNADLISRNRYGCNVSKMTSYQRKNFLNGPGKLCKGLDLTRTQNGLDLTGDELFVWDAGERVPAFHTSKRIGIDYAEEAVEFPWRFYL